MSGRPARVRPVGRRARERTPDALSSPPRTAARGRVSGPVPRPAGARPSRPSARVHAPRWLVARSRLRRRRRPLVADRAALGPAGRASRRRPPRSARRRPSAPVDRRNHAFAADAARRRRPRRVQPVPTHPLRRAARRRPADGAELIADRGRARVGRDRAAVRRRRARRTRRPSADRDAYEPERYGKRWAPVLVAWSTPEETPELAGDIVGIGGVRPRHARRRLSVYVTGSVTLDATTFAELLATAERHRATRLRRDHARARAPRRPRPRRRPDTAHVPARRARPSPPSAPVTSPGSPRSASGECAPDV